MTNEWNEFKTYTDKPTYNASGKRDTSYMGRFTFKTLTTFDGFSRILTILARGYLFHNPDGTLLDGSPYERIEHVKNALCAWCSIPDNAKKAPSKRPEPVVDFRELSDTFPELVNDKGEGWLYRHVRRIIRFVRKNPDIVSTSAVKNCDILASGFNREWKKKVKQFQVPIFALNTKGAWVLRFDDIIAEALEQGALRNTEIAFTPEEMQVFKDATPKGVPDNVIPALAAYYKANKRDDSEWVQLPVSSFDAYFGSTAFGKKWLSLLPKNSIERQQYSGVSRYKMIV